MKKLPTLTLLALLSVGLPVQAQKEAPDPKAEKPAGKSGDPFVKKGPEKGASAADPLVKPFGRHELLARVKTALRRVPTSTASPVRSRSSFAMGTLTVFPKELRAEKDGEEIELTPREASILILLHERRGEAVQRDDILDRCWGLEYYPESRTLDQHVAKLRKKIEDDPSVPTIVETVRGVGYRFR